MISLRRFCVIAARIRAASASSASSQLTRSHRPLPRGPERLHRVQDPVRVGDLVDRRRALGAVAAARPGMLRVALELAHLPGLPVHVGEQPARGLAVEAGGGDEHVVPLLAGRPGPGGQLHPVVPPFPGRERGQVHPARPLVEGLPARLGRGPGGRYPAPELVQGYVLGGPHGIDLPIGERVRRAVRTGRPARRRARRRAARPARAGWPGSRSRAPRPRPRSRTIPMPNGRRCLPRVSSCTASRAWAVTCGSVISPATSARWAAAATARIISSAVTARPGASHASSGSMAAAPASAACTARCGASSGLCHMSRALACANRYAV